MKNRLGAVVLLVFGTVIGIAGAAHAESWGPGTSSYNGTVRVEVSGDVWRDAAAIYDDVSLNDPSNDGNNVYSTARFAYCSGGSCDYSYNGANDHRSTGEYNYFNTPVSVQLSAPISPYAGSFERVNSWGCAQMGGFVPDSCSPNFYVTVTL